MNLKHVLMPVCGWFSPIDARGKDLGTDSTLINYKSFLSYYLFIVPSYRFYVTEDWWENSSLHWTEAQDKLRILIMCPPFVCTYCLHKTTFSLCYFLLLSHHLQCCNHFYNRPTLFVKLLCVYVTFCLFFYENCVPLLPVVCPSDTILWTSLSWTCFMFH